jgi:hypothetical protein
MRYIALIAAFVVMLLCAAPAHASLYIQAHQDDWQVLMGAWSLEGKVYGAYSDLASGGHVVLVFITAGDGGYGSDSYWQARERGTLASVSAVTGNSAWVNKTQTYHGHGIPQYTAGNVVCIFMRLPDDGDPKHSKPSTLAKLRSGGTPLVSVDGREDNYETWQELTSTLAEIISMESSQEKQVVWANALTYDNSCCGSEDHRYVAFAVQDATRSDDTRNWLKRTGKALRIAWFQGSGRDQYTGEVNNASVQRAMIDQRMLMFYAYEDEMLKYDPTGRSCTLRENPGLIGSWLSYTPPPATVPVVFPP